VGFTLYRSCFGCIRQMELRGTAPWRIDGEVTGIGEDFKEQFLDK
jgi:hypothetical protein